MNYESNNNHAPISRFKSVTFRRHKKHSTHCCATFTTAKRKCRRKIPCIYFKRLVSTVSEEIDLERLQAFELMNVL